MKNPLLIGGFSEIKKTNTNALLTDASSDYEVKPRASESHVDSDSAFRSDLVRSKVESLNESQPN